MELCKLLTASFDVDPQKGFTPLCANELPVPGGHEIVDALNEQASFASFRIGSKDAHPPNALWVADGVRRKQLDFLGGKNADVFWNGHCVVGTEGFELLDGLPHPMDYDFFVYKGVERDAHPYGACYHTLDWREHKRSTGVVEVLRSHAIEAVLVGGLATDYCVKNTVLQLRDAGFFVVVNLRACRGVSDETTRLAVAEMESSGAVVVRDLSGVTST